MDVVWSVWLSSGDNLEVLGSYKDLETAQYWAEKYAETEGFDFCIRTGCWHRRPGGNYSGRMWVGERLSGSMVN